MGYNQDSTTIYLVCKPSDNGLPISGFLELAGHILDVMNPEIDAEGDGHYASLQNLHQGTESRQLEKKAVHVPKHGGNNRGKESEECGWVKFTVGTSWLGADERPGVNTVNRQRPGWHWSRRSQQHKEGFHYSKL
jgi:hypothetical protein